jgi:hypothetical protein
LFSPFVRLILISVGAHSESVKGDLVDFSYEFRPGGNASAISLPARKPDER